MSNHAWSVTVSAHDLADTMRAYGLLYAKVRGGKHLHLYKMQTIHGGAFAAAWVACGVDVTTVAAAVAVACSGRELAEMTLPFDCGEKCTGRIEVLSAHGNNFIDNGITIKRRFGCKRDVVETLADTTRLPSLATSLLAPCTVSRVSATTQTADHLAMHVGPTTEWDVCPSLSTTAPVCFTALPDFPVEETIGHFFLSQAETA